MAPRILIIDDEVHLVKILEFILKRAGYETISAHDGKEGLETALAQRPDLVILDLTLPVLDGAEVCRGIRRAEGLSGVPVIMLTAHSRWGQGDEASISPDIWMEKPFNTGTLLEKIAELLARNNVQSI